MRKLSRVADEVKLYKSTIYKIKGGGRDFVNIENCLELARHKIDAMMYFELRMKNIIH